MFFTKHECSINRCSCYSIPVQSYLKVIFIQLLNIYFSNLCFNDFCEWVVEQDCLEIYCLITSHQIILLPLNVAVRFHSIGWYNVDHMS